MIGADARAPSAPSTGVQTLAQPRRDAMVIGERYVPGRLQVENGLAVANHEKKKEIDEFIKDDEVYSNYINETTSDGGHFVRGAG